MSRIRALRFVLAALVVSATSQAESPQRIPPPGKFGRWHPQYAEFQQLLAQHASRAKVHRSLAEGSVTPHDIAGKRQFLAIPPSMPPSKRALTLLEHWPRATYAQLIDDVRVLACFDSRDHLVAFEFF